MWKCSKCEAMVEDNEKVCPVCGEAFEADETETVTEETISVDAETNPEETVDETVLDDTAETEEIDEEEYCEDIVTFNEPQVWTCATCGAECEEDQCPSCGQLKPEEEPIVDFVPQKNNKIYGFVIAVAVVVAITVAIFTYFFLNRFVDKTGENHTITYQDIENSIDCIAGDKLSLKINGIDVPTSTFETIVASSAVVYQQQLCTDNMGFVSTSKLDNFKWTDIADKETNKTHKQIVMENAVNYCTELYSVISMGKKFNIQPSQVALEEIDKQIEDHKKNYGKDLKKLLKMSGYKDVAQYKEALLLYADYQAVVDDMDANPDRYIGKDMTIYNEADPSAISLKAILIYIDKENGVDKAAAKKKADKVLKKAKKGEDFGALVEEYDENGSTASDVMKITKGQMTAQFPEFDEFEKVAFKLDIDEVSKVIEAPNGYFILQRVATVDDAITYTTDNSKVSVNKSLLEDMKITVSFKDLYDEENK